MSDALGSQFFKPTGFERSFDAQNFSQQRPLRTSHKRTLDDAVRHIDTERDKTSAVSVSLEPGSGKTTVLPFRFSSTPVCVILPTGFDALAAFRLASDQANIDTGSYKENNGSNVTYMDSYTAGYSLFKYRDAFPYKVVIIDESDSNAGITKTLTEVKFKSSFVIHLSGTPEGREINSTTSFETEVSDTLPDLSDVYFEAVDFIKSRCEKGRSLVMVPSAAVARQIHSMIINSKKIDCEMSVEELDSLILDQTGDQIIVADDSCTRGINLNLDQVFDFQLVTAGDTIRSTTSSEQMQRRMRLGRTRVGKYYYTPREPSKDAHTKWDVFRNNVARAVFGLPLQACDMQIDFSRLKDLMVSRIEPYELQQSLPSLVKSPQVSRPKGTRKSSVSEKMEPWMLWVSGYGGKRRGSGSSVAAKSETSSSSSSSSSLRPEHSVSVVGSPKPSTMTTVPSSSFAPVQLERKRIPATSNGSALPVIDLSTGNMNSWPEALRAAYNNGDTLCMVKPGNWSYTSPGSGVDCLQKLIGVIRDGPAFTPAEMEVVCRAWNILVSRMNFSFASGKDAWGDSERVLFILDYFSSYNNMLLT